MNKYLEKVAATRLGKINLEILKKVKDPGEAVKLKGAFSPMFGIEALKSDMYTPEALHKLKHIARNPNGKPVLRAGDALRGQSIKDTGDTLAANRRIVTRNQDGVLRSNRLPKRTASSPIPGQKPPTGSERLVAKSKEMARASDVPEKDIIHNHSELDEFMTGGGGKTVEPKQATPTPTHSTTTQAGPQPGNKSDNKYLRNALIGGGAALGLGAVGYGIHKYRNRNKEDGRE